MSKTVPCPVTYWPGSVTLITPAPYPVVREWRRAVRAGVEYLDKCKAEAEAKKGTPLEDGDSYSYEEFEYNACYIPGILAFVEKWELGGDFPKAVNAETFPAQPLKAADELVQWLIAEIGKTFSESESVPNA